jgi:hypothetical protein
MRTVQRLVGKVGVTAVGLVMGLTLAAGSAAAAVHVTGTMASGHSINVAESNSSVDRSIGKEDSRVSGTFDRVSVDKVLEKKEALEPAQSAKHFDDSALKARDDSAGKSSADKKAKDDSASKPAATEDSARQSIHRIVVAAKAIEPSDKLDK